jgi:hypothetical protein
MLATKHTKNVATTFEFYEHVRTILIHFWQRGHSLRLCCLLQGRMLSRLSKLIHLFYHVFPCQELLVLATDAHRFITESSHFEL